MQRQYVADGLVCMSLSVDKKENQAKALKFLVAQNAAFPNYWLDEEWEAWQKKLPVSPPALFVFDRQGRRAARFDNDDPDKTFTHTDVENLVRKLLRQPAGSAE